MTLKLDSGKHITRESCPEENFELGWYGPNGEENVAYFLADYLDESGYFYIKSFFYEGGYDELISRTNGKTYGLLSEPNWSVNRDMFLVMDSVADDAETHEIQIWSINKKQATMELSYKPGGWPLVSAIWDNNDAVGIVLIQDSIVKQLHGISLDAGDLLGHFKHTTGSWAWVPVE